MIASNVQSKTICACGSTFRKGDNSRHNKSLKHQQWICSFNSPKQFWSSLQKTNLLCALEAYNLYEKYCIKKNLPVNSKLIFYESTKLIPDIDRYLDLRSWKDFNQSFQLFAILKIQ